MSRFVLLLLLCCTSHLLGQARFHQVFQDHMVLQEGEEVNVYGFGLEGEELTVTLGKEIRQAKVVDGKWEVTFDSHKRGGPYSIVLQAGTEKTSLQDIYFGWVFLCGGQSNMEWGVGQINNAAVELADANYPMIRLLSIDKQLSNQPKADVACNSWELANKETVADFSAIGFLTARSLYNKYKVPIGLIDNAWGGSEIDTWMEASLFDDKTFYKDQIQAYSKISDIDQEEAAKALVTWQQNVENEDIGIKENWAQKINFAGWQEISVPGAWENGPLPKYDGVAWYAHSFTLDHIPSSALLSVGRIDDTDFTYINGHQVGHKRQAYNVDRKYEINPSWLKKGTNTITIKVVDTGGGGGITGTNNDIYLQYDDEMIALHGTWKIKASTTHYPYPANIIGHNDYPTSKYNAMVAPLVRQKLAGIMWYQGESDAALADDYDWKFLRLINDYRAQWKQAKLPFLFVQLASFMEEATTPGNDSWAQLRKAQTKALLLENTSMISAIDVGDAEDIHPKDKQTLANRMVQSLESLLVTHNNTHTAAYPSSCIKTPEGYEIKFENLHGGLTQIEVGLDPKFSVPDGKGSYRWATGVLQDNQTMLIRCTPHSGIIRYLWSSNPGKISIYEGKGRPLNPFEILVD